MPWNAPREDGGTHSRDHDRVAREIRLPREVPNGQQGPHATQAAPPEAAQAEPSEFGAAPKSTEVSAAQQVAQPATELNPPSGPTLAQTDPDADRVRQAIAFYRKGDLAGGDAVAKTATSPIARLTMEWAALKLQLAPGRPGARGCLPGGPSRLGCPALAEAADGRSPGQSARDPEGGPFRSGRHAAIGAVPQDGRGQAGPGACRAGARGDRLGQRAHQADLAGRGFSRVPGDRHPA